MAKDFICSVNSPSAEMWTGRGGAGLLLTVGRYMQWIRWNLAPRDFYLSIEMSSKHVCPVISRTNAWIWKSHCESKGTDTNFHPISAVFWRRSMQEVPLHSPKRVRRCANHSDACGCARWAPSSALKPRGRLSSPRSVLSAAAPREKSATAHLRAASAHFHLAY